MLRPVPVAARSKAWVCGRSPAEIVGSNPTGVWMYVSCELSGRVLFDELITRPEESYRLWCVVVCDLETSWVRRPWPTGGGGCHAKNKQCMLRVSVLGEFATMRQATVSFVMSVHLHGTNRLPLDGFSWNLILFENLSTKLKVSLKSDTNNRHFIRRPVWIYEISHLILFRMRYVSRKFYKANKNTFCVQ